MTKENSMAELSNGLRRKEGHPFPTTGAYINALKNKFELDTNSMFSNEASIERFEKDESILNPVLWLEAVKLKEDAKWPRARIETDMGRGPIYSLNKDTELPDDPEEAVTQEGLLNALAVTEAKLIVVKENAPEAYALLHTRVDSSLAHYREARKKLMTQEQEKTLSLKELLESTPNPQRKQQALTTAAVAALAITACTSAVNPTISPDLTPTEPRVEEIEETPSPTPRVEATKQVPTDAINEPEDTSTPETQPTPTIPSAPALPYPRTDTKFTSDYDSEDDYERLQKLAEEDELLVNDMREAERLIRLGAERSGKSISQIKWGLNESGENPSWTLVAFDGNGRPLTPRLTEGEEENEMVRSMNVIEFRNLQETFGDDFFNLEPVPNLPGTVPVDEYGFEDDESGWITLSASVAGKPAYWLDLETNEWKVRSGFLPEGSVNVERSGEGIVAKDADGEVLWEFNAESGEWVKNGKSAVIGHWWLETSGYDPDNLENILEPVNPEIEKQFSYNEDGKDIPYGYYKKVDNQMLFYGRKRMYFEPPDTAGDSFRGFIFDIPEQRYNDETDKWELVPGGDNQYVVVNIPESRIRVRYFVSQSFNTSDVEEEFLTLNEFKSILRDLPNGAPVIFGVQSWDGPYKKENERQQFFIEAIENGELVDDNLFLGPGNGGIIDSSLLVR